MGIKEFSKRHPIGLYFLAAFAISWTASIFSMGVAYVRGTTLTIDDILIPGLLMVAGPCISGVALTIIVFGKRGLIQLFQRMIKWRVGATWYLPLLIFPSLLLTVSIVLSTFVSTAMSPLFFAPGILMGLIAGFIEETGWMGFAYPIMRKKRGAWSAALILGFLHSLWHIVADFLGNSRNLGWYWLPYFAGFFVFVMALRILIVWVYENTGSLLLSQLMHASSTGFFGILIPMDIPPSNRAIFYGVYAAVLTLAAGIVVAVYGRNLRRGDKLSTAGTLD